MEEEIGKLTPPYYRLAHVIQLKEQDFANMDNLGESNQHCSAYSPNAGGVDSRVIVADVAESALTRLLRLAY